jgi:hypothetical protein
VNTAHGSLLIGLSFLFNLQLDQIDLIVCSGRLFQPGLMFVDKARMLGKDMICWGSLPGISHFIELNRKLRRKLSVLNTDPVL